MKHLILDIKSVNPFPFLDLLNTRISNVTLCQFLKVFDLRKIDCDCYAYRGRIVVVLGNSARKLLRLPPLLLHPQEINETIWRQIPSPESQPEWYAEETHRDLVALLFESLYEERRKCS